MKIAIVLHPIMDLGGIINHTEDLAWGFRELGHKVNLHFVNWRKSVQAAHIKANPQWKQGAFDILVNQKYGWDLKPGVKIAYKGEENIKKTKDKLQSYDLVVWEIPVPTMSNNTENNHDWKSLYDITTPQVAIIHDGNLLEGYPWLYEVRDHIKGLACVHDCAYNSASQISIPRALILNPQDISKHEGIKFTPYEKRTKGFLSLQTFKRWKRVDDLIRAIPYMDSKTQKYLAGGGIEQRYMTSKDKTKEEYYARRLEDPSVPVEIENKITIWDRGLYYGMRWLGYISNQERDKLLIDLRALIDPSWALTYISIGGHYNRTVVDAMLMEVIPVATRLGMLGSKGRSYVFKENVNFIPVLQDETPRQYAARIEHACNLSKAEAQKIIEANNKLLPLFERKKVAQQFIDLSRGKPTGLLNKLETGTNNQDLIVNSHSAMKNFFGYAIEKSRWGFSK